MAPTYMVRGMGSLRRWRRYRSGKY